jgi:GT2 family glycosyltransferase
MEIMVKLSVIICSGGRPESLKKTVKSLEAQSFSDWELVVVKERPLARARDLGWRRAKGELVAWIDDDVVLSKNWAKNLVKIFDEDPKVGGVSGPTLVPEKLLNNRLVFWWYGRDDFLAKVWVKWVLQGRPSDVGRIYSNGWWSPGSNFKSCLKLKGLWEVDYLEACNMCLRRELVKRVGGFDKGYKGTAEWCELDLAMRVKELGIRLVWSRGVRLRHEVSQGGVYVDRRKILERVRNYLKWRRRWL